MVCMCLITSLHGQWVSRYHSVLPLMNLTDKAQSIFERTDIAPFSQLIWSFGAPDKILNLEFYIQVRDAHTKQWGTWIKMLEYHQGKYTTFVNDLKGGQGYFHVRYEMGKNHRADGFKIKALAPDNKSFALVYLTVTTSAVDLFQPEQALKVAPGKRSIHLNKVSKISQFKVDHPRNNEICSPSTCTMLINYVLKKPYNPLHVAQSVYDHGLARYGSWPCNMAYANQCAHGKFYFYVTRMSGFAELHSVLAQGVPVGVSITGPITGGATEYKSGHLILIVGWDARKKEILCHDPAHDLNQSCPIRYKLADFLSAWEKSRRLAYVACQT